MIEDEAFREDLLARLAGFELELPPLADRRVDLGAMLAEITPDAHVRRRHDPRAARLRVAAQRPRAGARGRARRGTRRWRRDHARAPARRDRDREVHRAPVAPPDARREELVALLEKHKGNVSKVAADLGRVRQQVQRWLKRYGLDPERYRT